MTTRLRAHPRAGTTLVELVVAMLVTAIMGAIALRVLDRALRFVEGTALVAESRAQQAAAQLAARTAIEEVAVSEGDLRRATDSSLTWSGAVGHAVSCALVAQAVDVPPANLVIPIPLVWWIDAPQQGDVVALLDEGGRAGGMDDRWWESRLVSALPLSNACSGAPYVDAVADAGKRGWRLVLSDSISPTVRPGAPLRVLRPQRLALYRSGTIWTLGWADSSGVAGSWNVIQPLAGPLAPPGAGAGLLMTWLDSARSAMSVPVVSTSAVRSARVALRSQTTSALRMDGRARGVRVDSLVLTLPIRNRR